VYIIYIIIIIWCLFFVFIFPVRCEIKIPTYPLSAVKGAKNNRMDRIYM